ncbi:uncharacterized protein HI_0912 [Aspergillus udagawae]|nr:uncharacterized protein HI_0912 [Aspergillus udagawae]
MSSPVTQNIYDNSRFFDAYATPPRSQEGLSAAKEWSTIKDMVLGNQQTLRKYSVLDLGCGYGWFARWARESGATFIKAVDISENMIQRAKAFELSHGTAGLGSISYHIADIETIILDNEPAVYDIVYSSLTFHYIYDFARVLQQIRSCIRKGGRLVFSIEHPVATAPVDPGPAFQRMPRDDRDGAQGMFWPINSYEEEGPRYTNWLGVGGVKKYHRTLETYLRLLRENGFALIDLREWTISREDAVKQPEYAAERQKPYFLLVSSEAV